MTKLSRIRRELRHLLEQFNRRTARELRETEPSLAEVLEPRSLPRLSWVNLKTRATHSGGRSGISGFKPELLEACTENASRIFATEVQKATLDKANDNIAEVNAAIAARSGSNEPISVLGN